MVHVQDVCALMEKQTGREITLPYQMTASRIDEGVRLYRSGTHKAGTGTWQEKGCFLYTSDMDRGIFKFGDERYSYDADLYICEDDLRKQMCIRDSF